MMTPTIDGYVITHSDATVCDMHFTVGGRVVMDAPCIEFALKPYDAVHLAGRTHALGEGSRVFKVRAHGFELLTCGTATAFTRHLEVLEEIPIQEFKPMCVGEHAETDKDGRLHLSVTHLMSDGALVTIAVRFAASGHLEGMWADRNGIPIGASTLYNPDGSVQSQTHFRDGDTASTYECSPRGTRRVWTEFTRST